MMQMKGVRRVCALRMKYGEYVDDIHVLLHTYNDTHTQHSVKKYIYFIWRGLFFCGGATFQLEEICISFGVSFVCVFQQEQDSSSFQEEGANHSNVSPPLENYA